MVIFNYFIYLLPLALCTPIPQYQDYNYQGNGGYGNLGNGGYGYQGNGGYGGYQQSSFGPGGFGKGFLNNFGK